MSHIHLCDCGRGTLHCEDEPDKCPVRQFVCPRCIDDALEADIVRLELSLNPTLTLQEPTHESE